MAEEDAEIALLRQLQAGQEGAWNNNESGETAEGESPSNIENITQEDVKREIVADDQVLRALSPSGAGAVSDDGDYDPSSVTSLPAITIAGQGDSRSSSRASIRKKKTVGGFIADDSDEEYDASTPVPPLAGLQAPANQTPNRAISPSPLQTSVSQHDVQIEPTNQGDSEAPQASHALPVTSIVEVPSVQAQAPAPQANNPTVPQVQVATIKARLPNDKTGILEDRIKEDPRGDLDAWLALIDEHRKKNKIDDARHVYERFFKVFPQAAETWVAYIEMELELNNFTEAENIFGRSLLAVPNVQLWSTYLDYIRRRNDLINDMSGTARTTVSQAYDFVLANIGIDKDSGKLWHEYLQFIRSAPGQMGGNGWQDQQKMDQLRKAYQRAIVVPMSALNGLWKDYDQFEMQLNKTTGRKFLQEKSPAYMTARSANNNLENLTRGIIRTTLPRLPPMLGFEGDQEYLQQVDMWKKWIAYEQEDPVQLKDEGDVAGFRQRVLYVYKQAVMALRFWPEIWVDAAEWCYNNELDKDGDTFLADGVAANPESCLVAFKRADRLETTLATAEPDKSIAERGAIVRAPFQELLNTLYSLIDQLKARKAKDLAKLDESAAIDDTISAIIGQTDDDDEENANDKAVKEAMKAAQTKAITDGYAMQTELLSKTISFAWVALMRAMRRVEGKGSPKAEVGGLRQIFADARARGKLTSDVYVAAALIEHHVYKEPAGTKIFERGAKLFPEDAAFTLEYIKHLLSIGDLTNARVTFEQAVNRLTQKPELLPNAKPLYAFFHKYESQYGELSQISKLEQRMAEIYPEDPKLVRFASRYSSEGFDPTAVRLIISQASQMRPKQLMQSIEQQPSMHNSPAPQFHVEASPRPMMLQATNSPKRPYPMEDMDNESNAPKRMARGPSPLKGAAGRRLDQQKRMQGTPGTAPPFVVPRDITFLLNIIPPASTYNSTKFKPDAMVRLLRETIVPDFKTWKLARAESEAPPQSQQRYDNRRPQNKPQQQPLPQNNFQNYQPPPQLPQQYAPQQNNGNGVGMWPPPQQQQGIPGYPAPQYPVVNHDQYNGAPPGMHGLPPRPPPPSSAGSGTKYHPYLHSLANLTPGFPPTAQYQAPSGYGAVGDGSRRASGGDGGGGMAATPPRLWSAERWYSG